MLNVSIVLYNHTKEEIAPLVETLAASKNVNTIFIIDNSPKELSDADKLPAKYIYNGKNLGYGKAHNVAIRKTIENRIPYHLVINPDITFKTGILEKIEDFMDCNPEIGHLMPKILYPSGDIQHLCKLLPTPFDLIFRRFLPAKWTEKRTKRFELHEYGYNQIMDVPYLSGCFMFLRTAALLNTGLFDERFFMYPEDIDLTRRIHAQYRTVYYPHAEVTHVHTRSSYKNMKMLYIHISNMIKYFNKWGWVFDKERKQINKETIQRLNDKVKTSSTQSVQN